MSDSNNLMNQKHTGKGKVNENDNENVQINRKENEMIGKDNFKISTIYDLHSQSNHFQLQSQSNINTGKIAKIKSPKSPKSSWSSNNLNKKGLKRLLPSQFIKSTSSNSNSNSNSNTSTNTNTNINKNTNILTFNSNINKNSNSDLKSNSISNTNPYSYPNPPFINLNWLADVDTSTDSLSSLSDFSTSNTLNNQISNITNTADYDLSSNSNLNSNSNQNSQLKNKLEFKNKPISSTNFYSLPSSPSIIRTSTSTSNSNDNNNENENLFDAAKTVLDLPRTHTLFMNQDIKESIITNSIISDTENEDDKDTNLNIDDEEEENDEEKLIQEDLFHATGGVPSIVLELSLDGIVKYISSSWETIIGTEIREIIYKPISNVVIGDESDKNIFLRATNIMEKDDTSYTIRFLVKTGKFYKKINQLEFSDSDPENDENNNYHDIYSKKEDNNKNDEKIEINNDNELKLKSIHSSPVVSTLTLDKSIDFTIDDAISKNSNDSPSNSSTSNDSDIDYQEIEGQGMLIHDWKTDKITHTMWILRPYIQPKPLTINIKVPDELNQILGSGIDLFASYLNSISNNLISSMESLPTPPLVLCRICEQNIPTWWLERHSELCLVEHKAESDVQDCNDLLVDHLNILLKLINSYEEQEKKHSPRSSSLFRSQSETNLGLLGIVHSSSTQTSSSNNNNNNNNSNNNNNNNNNNNQLEYNGLPLPPLNAPSSVSSSSNKPRHSAMSAFRRHKSSAAYSIGRNTLKVLYILREIIDLAISINPAEIKSYPADVDEIRAHSPHSETAIKNLKIWSAPVTDDPTLKIICKDTENLSKSKIDSVIRLGSSITYAEKIRREVEFLVMKVIEEAVLKIKEMEYDQNDDDDDDQVDTTITEDNDDNDSSKRSSIVEVSKRNRSISITRSHHKSKSSSNSNLNSNSQIYIHPSHSNSKSSNSSSPAQVPLRKAVTSRVSSSGITLTNYSIASGNGGIIPTSRPETPVSGISGVSSESSNLSFSRGRNINKRNDSNYDPDIRSITSHDLSINLENLEISKKNNSKINQNLNNSPRSSIKGARSRGKSTIAELSPLVLSSNNNINESNNSMDHVNKRFSLHAGTSNSDKAPISPLMMTNFPVPQQKSSAPSIRDYEIINPISKGAFGSVYLAKRKLTNEYFAIKVLKKQDMISKNQVTNVKAERAIMMSQAESSFVAKLYYTFQNKDYLFLVMEYLNGGDFASLLKALGTIQEEWAKQYIAEIVMAVDDLHEKGIVHRDLKPDNFLIDHQGHIKLTDFGLSRMGLVKRQARARNNKGVSNSTVSVEKAVEAIMSAPTGGNVSNHQQQQQQQQQQSRANSLITPFQLSPSTPSTNATKNAGYFSSHDPLSSTNNNPDGINLSNYNRPLSVSSEKHFLLNYKSKRSDSIGSDFNSSPMNNYMVSNSLNTLRRSSSQKSLGTSTIFITDDESINQSPQIIPINASSSSMISSYSLNSHTTTMFNDLSSPSLVLFDPDKSNASKKFVGTPDYLAPETISGAGQDASSDWWSLGCILFEFIFGYPPFQASSPEKIFTNILNCNIQWMDLTEEEERTICSKETKDLILKLLVPDPSERLGSKDANDIKSHPFFNGIDWDKLLEGDVLFVPDTSDPEATDYFDPRGASLDEFPLDDDDQDTNGKNEMAKIMHENLAFMDDSHENSSVTSHDYHGFEKDKDSPFETISKGKALPPHIPPHIRDRKSSLRSNDSTSSDQFGSFAFKNLYALEKANKDIINRLKTEHLEHHYSMSTSSSESGNSTPVTPTAGIGGLRRLSTSATHKRSDSRNSMSFVHSNSPHKQQLNPNEGSYFIQFPDTDSPLVDLININDNASESSTNSQNMQSMAASVSGSPGKARTRRRESLTNFNMSQQQDRTRAKSKGRTSIYFKNGTFDSSPTNSDSEEVRSQALKRVRKRQSLRIGSGSSNPSLLDYRPLDVLVGDSNPLWRFSLLRMLEKIGCIVVPCSNGDEIIRRATGEVKFDVIFTDLKSSKLNGDDVARLLHHTSNTNSHTPIVAVTAFAKEAISTNAFDAVIGKPFTNEKLQDVLKAVCFWRPKD